MLIARTLAIVAILACLAVMLAGCGAGQPPEAQASVGTPIRGCPGANGELVPCPG